MKIKNFLFVVVALGAVFTAGCQQKADPVLNKKQVIAKVKKPFHSGQMNESLVLNNGLSSASSSKCKSRQ